jgi:hypothetical protein
MYKERVKYLEVMKVVVKKYYENNKDKVAVYKRKHYAYKTECRRLASILLD